MDNKLRGFLLQGLSLKKNPNKAYIFMLRQKQFKFQHDVAADTTK